MSLNRSTLVPDNIHEEYVHPAVYIGAAIALGLIGFFGFTMNLLVAVVIVKDAQNLWTPVNVILVNLVVGDFLVAALGNPVAMVSAITGGWYWGYKVRLVHVHVGIRQHREPDGNGGGEVAAGGQTDESVIHTDSCDTWFLRLDLRSLPLVAAIVRLGKLRTGSRKRVLQRVLGGPRSNYEKRQLHRLPVHFRPGHPCDNHQHQLPGDRRDAEESPEESRFTRKTGSEDHEDGRLDDHGVPARLVTLRGVGSRRSVFRREAVSVGSRAASSASEVFYLLQPDHLRGPEQPIPAVPEEDIRHTEHEDHGGGEPEHGADRPEQAGSAKLGSTELAQAGSPDEGSKLPSISANSGHVRGKGGTSHVTGRSGSVGEQRHHVTGSWRRRGGGVAKAWRREASRDQTVAEAWRKEASRDHAVAEAWRREALRDRAVAKAGVT